jgi:hypothetical protein
MTGKMGVNRVRKPRSRISMEVIWYVKGIGPEANKRVWEAIKDPERSESEQDSYLYGKIEVYKVETDIEMAQIIKSADEFPMMVKYFRQHNSGKLVEISPIDVKKRSKKV